MGALLCSCQGSAACACARTHTHTHTGAWHMTPGSLYWGVAEASASAVRDGASDGIVLHQLTGLRAAVPWIWSQTCLACIPALP